MTYKDLIVKELEGIITLSSSDGIMVFFDSPEDFALYYDNFDFSKYNYLYYSPGEDMYFHITTDGTTEKLSDEICTALAEIMSNINEISAAKNNPYYLLDLDEAVEYACNQIKATAYRKIIAKWPYWKQLNLNSGDSDLSDADELTQKNADVSTITTFSDECEEQVTACTAVEDIEALEFEWPDI